MKKWIAFLLSAVTVLSFCACNTSDAAPNDSLESSDFSANWNDTEPDVEINQETNENESNSSDAESEKYYKIEQIGLTTVRYCIYDSQGRVVFTDETDSPLDISMLGETIVDVCIDEGTGHGIHQYYDVQNNRFSEKYAYVAAASGNLVAYIDMPKEDPLLNRKLVVCDIFDRNEFYKEFFLNFSPTEPMPIERAEFTEDENELRITYLTAQAPDSFSPILPIRYDHTFNDYDSILHLYEKIIDFCAEYEDFRDDRLEHSLGLTEKWEIDLFGKLLSSAYLFYLGRGEPDSAAPYYKTRCGYAIKDLNRDGVDELVLLNDDYRIVAIFSMSDGKPILLGNYIPRGSCWIDGDGLLHLNGSGGADVSIHSLYKIASGGASLELIAGFGLDGHEWVDGIAVQKYYRLEDGEKVWITEAEYDALSAQYGKYLGVYAGPSATKEYSGLTLTPLFSYTEAELARQSLWSIH